MDKIVVGIDGSESADNALRWAVGEAELHQWPITAVLAWGYLQQHHADPNAEFDPDYTEQDAVAALDAYIERALGPARGADIDRRVVCDLSAPALLDASAEASLLVLGARGLGGFKGLLLGSVSQQCLTHATGPVAIVRTPEGGTQEDDKGRIIVGVDGSDTSRRALRWGADEARLRHVPLQVVMSWHTPYVGGFPYAATGFDSSILERDARKTLDEVVDGVDTTDIPQVDRTLKLGDAATSLLTIAGDADLLVVGSRGLGGFTGLLLGSVSHHVAHHAKGPVVVIPPGV